MSDPVLQYNIPETRTASGNEDPQSIRLTLTPGQVSNQTVSLYGPAVGSPLILGSTVNATLSTPGEQDHYTLTLAASSLLYFDSLTNGNFQWSLTGPGGTPVSGRSFTNSDGNSGPSDPVLSLPAGSYTLTVSGSGQTIGAYSFRMLDLAAGASVTPGTPVSGTLSPANSTDIYRFTASAGDTDYFASLSSNTQSADWRLIDPYGNVLFSNGMSRDGGRLTLSATGTYTVLVKGYIGDTGTTSYSFNVEFQGNVPPPPPVGTPLTLGSTVNATLSNPRRARPLHLHTLDGCPALFRFTDE